MNDGGGGGGGGGEGKDLQVEGLALITEGINLAMSELRELGMVGEASVGRGFADLALSGLELGHGGLTSALDTFCERWEWGVRALILEGSNFADAVGLAAGTFHETEQYIDGTFKIAANSVMGNPHLGEDQVTQMTWGEIGDNHMFATSDWSAESWERAQENTDQAWNDAQRDVMTSPVLENGPLDPQQAMGMTDQEYEASLDEQYGPSREEREQAAQAAAEENQRGGGAG
ncbi:hypothetical protein PV755_31885 [Streptomyces caniscabiei]|uniref:Uncharacterized protein n=1 Tax=Streptomyces caniscabiei TaxID=2746961 RepID=A0A927QJA3_9ACTN|nr:hypothetical protein [Streptomyces caniscabiei]MBD9727875.1 hypothetical protein [Streptomyces caniscabiei]MDX3513450.1 hypothetical protein [Streptomyces caniscabiei]MDX3722416.1 hypothetical protein [Streptomyces caniscabiei]WEO27434.1 hypothetical protein IHE65_32160 [Streptomyces caniscabiei]